MAIFPSEFFFKLDFVYIFLNRQNNLLEPTLKVCIYLVLLLFSVKYRISKFSILASYTAV
jgi:hypothetical protein